MKYIVKSKTILLLLLMALCCMSVNFAYAAESQNGVTLVTGRSGDNITLFLALDNNDDYVKQGGFEGSLEYDHELLEYVKQTTLYDQILYNPGWMQGSDWLSYATSKELKDEGKIQVDNRAVLVSVEFKLKDNFVENKEYKFKLSFEDAFNYDQSETFLWSDAVLETSYVEYSVQFVEKNSNGDIVKTYASQSVTKGKQPDSVEIPKKDGYTFKEWKLEDGTGTVSDPVTEPKTFVAVWEANKDTSYKVEHYQQNLDDDEYTLSETESLTGTTDTEVTAAEKEYEGFTYDASVSETVKEGTIAGNGSLVLKLYYTRNSYPLTYKYEGTTPEGASALPGAENYRYGASVTAAEPATAPGYTFSGWSEVPTTMPANKVEITGSFTANTDTPYTVKHYQQNLENDSYTLIETENLKGTTDTEVTATAKTYPGFHYVESTSTASGTINGSGSLVLNLYYDRETYTVTYTKGIHGTFADKVFSSLKFGVSTPTLGDDEITGEDGYTFTSWLQTVAETVTETVEYVAQWSANTDTAYKVEHYKQNVNDDDYTLAETEDLTGTTDTEVTATEKTYEGFTYDANASGSVKQGTIAGNGSLVLKLYYTRNSYSLTYKYGETVPDGASALPEEATYRYGASVTAAEPATAPGYTFSGWSEVPTTMPANKVEITGSFAANTDTLYVVNHYQQNLENDNYTLVDTENLTGTTDTGVTATTKTYTGFHYVESKSTASGTINGSGSLVLNLYYDRDTYTVTYTKGIHGTFADKVFTSLKFGVNTPTLDNNEITGEDGYTFTSWLQTVAETVTETVEYVAQWSANTDTAYKVEHYKQNVDDDDYTLSETESLTGTTDTKVTATEKTYEGFTFDASVSGTAKEGTIAGNGSLVLKLYYTRNSYSLTYKYEGTTPEGASALPGAENYRYGASVTAAEPATAPGYTFSGWSEVPTTMPANKVEITGSFTANTDTPYTVKHYQQNLENDSYTLVDTENLTGTTDTEVTATEKTYEGFTYDDTVSGTVKKGKIAGDGSLILELYYTRNNYSVNIENWTNIDDAKLINGFDGTATYRYGSTVSFSVAADLATVVATHQNGSDVKSQDGTFTRLKGQKNEDGSYQFTFTMPSENIALTLAYKGDLNLDAKVNTRDSQLAAKVAGRIIDSETLSKLQLLVGDVARNDGKIDTYDSQDCAKVAGRVMSYEWD